MTATSTTTTSTTTKQQQQQQNQSKPNYDNKRLFAFFKFYFSIFLFRFVLFVCELRSTWRQFLNRLHLQFSIRKKANKSRPCPARNPGRWNLSASIAKKNKKKTVNECKNKTKKHQKQEQQYERFGLLTRQGGREVNAAANADAGTKTGY